MLAAAAATAWSCGEEEAGPSPIVIPLEITYPAPTAPDPRVERDHPGCVGFVSPTHFHGTWDDMRRRLMEADGPELWRASTSVPGAGRYTLRIEDPNTCGRRGGDGVQGSVFDEVIRVNGTRLTEETLTDSFEGPRHSFTFVVSFDGTVSN